MRQIYLVFILFFILIFSLISTYLIQNNPSYFKAKVLHNISSVDIFTQNNQLKVNFQIVNSDKENAKIFSNNLGVDADWLEGLSLLLDSNTIDKIKQSLPLHGNIKFSDKQLDLTSQSSSNLNSSLPIQNYQMATGSGRLTFSTRGSDDFDLIIVDPDPIIKYASSSGKLYLSSQSQQLFPILNKIAKIILVVKNKNVTGNILLK